VLNNWCSECNMLMSDKYCWRCGKKTLAAELKCPLCGKGISVMSKFCGSCGRPVQEAVQLHIQNQRKGGGDNDGADGGDDTRQRD